jgi:hypothetical protein
MVPLRQTSWPDKIGKMHGIPLGIEFVYPILGQLQTVEHVENDFLAVGIFDAKFPKHGCTPLDDLGDPRDSNLSSSILHHASGCLHPRGKGQEWTPQTL